jgi:DNA primase
VPQFSAEHVAQIVDRLDIVQLVGEYLSLRKAGVNYLGLCPFHNEKSPSFNVNPGRRMFHCFGCQEGGDVIKFYMKIEGLAFPQAVERLAERVGVELPKDDWQSKRAKIDKTHEQELLGLNRQALSFFQEQIKAPHADRARMYLISRDVDDDLCLKHQLGYAPESWNSLTHFLFAKSLPLSWAAEVGLIIAKENNQQSDAKEYNRYYDRFRDRIMFPVLSSSGDVLGFSGRTLQKETKDAKYLNSPESIVFKKGESFLGLALAKMAIRKAKYAILVEGNFDYLSLHQKGIEEAVAPMGTALTMGAVRALRRYTGESVILCYDADSAGQKAIRRAIPLLLEGGLFPRVAHLPEGEDPDSFAKKHSTEELKHFFLQAKDAIEFWIDDEDQKTKGNIPARAKAAEEIFHVVQQVKDQAAKDLYEKKLDGRFWIDKRALAQAKSTPRPTEPLPVPPSEPELPKGELELVKLVFYHRPLWALAKESGVSKLLVHPATQECIEKIEVADPEISSENFLDSLSNDGIKQALRAVLFRAESMEEDLKKAEQSLRKTIYYLKDQSFNRLITRENTEMKSSMAAGEQQQAVVHALRIQTLKREQELLRRVFAKNLPA